MSPVTFSAKRRRRPTPLLDFSAMSALGLMLVNFFMVQMMWEKPQVMPLEIPNYGCWWDDYSRSESTVLTLLCAQEKVYNYNGITEPKLDSVDYSPHGLRQLILSEKQKVNARYGLDEYTELKTGTLKKGSYLNIIIKALPSATYGNIVDVLDEMCICGIRYYLILDVSPAEMNFVHDPAKGLNFFGK